VGRDEHVPRPRGEWAGEDFDPREWEDAEEGEEILLPLDESRFLAVPKRLLGRLLGTVMELFQREREGVHLHAMAAAQVAAALPEFVAETNHRLRKMANAIKNFRHLKPVALPSTLKAELRDYQVEGVTWLQFLRGFGLGGILADDMGLGKTVQTLAHLLVERRARRAQGRPSLIVAPTSVISNWEREAERFAPCLDVLLLHGQERFEKFDHLSEADLVLTSFALLTRDGEVYQEQEFHYVILDEAQSIKNPNSKLAQIVCGLHARHRLCLTGTPLENHLGELWSLMHFLMPGFLGDAKAFQKHWRKPIEKERDVVRRRVLVKRLAPLMLRRTRDEVLEELPPRTETLQTVTLPPGQAELYESVRATMNAKVRDAIAAKGLNRSSIVVLDALLKLRQVCCHPKLLKVKAAAKVKRSAKLESFLELMRDLSENEENRILVFSQFTSMLEIIEERFAEEGISSIKLTGETPGRERQALVDQFQKGEVPVFLISLKAGGSGLNLTAANTVVHYDPWWNPAVEEQATGRAHRMGQQNPVFVYRFVTQGTIEERILELQERKAEMARAILGDDLEPGERKQGWGLEQEDLEALFAPLQETR
ncbi:MAG: DEAD/DEAH box helicase, partial [Verrucomicrobiota bacterium]